MEIGLDAKIVPTLSFEEIKNQIESKWREEIRVKMAEVSNDKCDEISARLLHFCILICSSSILVGLFLHE